MTEVPGEGCPVCAVLEGRADADFWTRHQYRLRKGEMEAHLGHGGVASDTPALREAPEERAVAEESAIALVRSILPQLRRGIRLAAHAHDTWALRTMRQDLQEAIEAALEGGTHG